MEEIELKLPSPKIEIILCKFCKKFENGTNKTAVRWYEFDFCDVECLRKYRSENANICHNCQSKPENGCQFLLYTRASESSFCSFNCYKTVREKLRLCFYCLRNRGCRRNAEQPTFTCSDNCTKVMKRIQGNSPLTECSTCKYHFVPKIEVLFDGNSFAFCKNKCYAKYGWYNKLMVACEVCKIRFRNKDDLAFVLFENKTDKIFCSSLCLRKYVSSDSHLAKCTQCNIEMPFYSMIRACFNDNEDVWCSIKCNEKHLNSKNDLNEKRVKNYHELIARCSELRIVLTDCMHGKNLREIGKELSRNLIPSISWIFSFLNFFFGKKDSNEKSKEIIKAKVVNRNAVESAKNIPKQNETNDKKFATKNDASEANQSMSLS